MTWPDAFRRKSKNTTSALERQPFDLTNDVHGPLGLSLLHAPSESLIDFVFVHGLRGGSRKTWSKSEKVEQFWPARWLPADPQFKNVRIHSFGYNSNWLERRRSALTIHDFGQALLSDIQNSPELSGAGAQTPIVLIGHSLGGIVIKKTFLLAKQDPNYRELGGRFYALFFLGTPHRGSDSAQLLNKIIRLSYLHGSKPYVRELIPNSGAIQVINDEFRHVYQGAQLWSFFETVATKIGIIVEKDSAVLGLPGERVELLNADHRNLCKFEDPSDSNYRTLRNAFASTINSIEKTCLSSRKDEHHTHMQILSHYLGVFERPEADLASITDKQTEGSCQWLTSLSSFRAWYEGSDTAPKLYWLSGEPATGKSTMAGHVIRYLEDCNSDCTFFFFKHGDITKSSLAALLRSLAWQMAWVNTDVRNDLLMLERQGSNVAKADERVVWRNVFVNRIFRIELRQPCYWVIDGLDECVSHGAFFPLLAKVEGTFPLRIFLTSRPSLLVEKLLAQEKIANITQLMNLESCLRDIKLFLETHAGFLPLEDELARYELIEKILRKSNGNFLWTSLVLKELETTYSVQQIYEVLESVPAEMEGLYTRILDNLNSTPRNKDLAKAILRWTVCAARSLSVEELKEALRLDIQEEVPRLDIAAASICGNLVYVDSQTRVQLAHQTVRTFLVRENQISDFAIVRQHEHLRLAQVCLRYLSSDELKTSRSRRGSMRTHQVKRSVFSEYAIVHFSDHVVLATSSEHSQLIALHAFLQSNSLTWIELVAARRYLHPLTQTARNLKKYLEQGAKYHPPLGKEIQSVSAWSRDLIYIVARFGKTLLASPTSIQFLIPSVCPRSSIIAKSFGDYPRPLQLTGLSNEDWDDRLCCIVMPETQALSVACQDTCFALGYSDGSVHIYDSTTTQEKLELCHGEAVRHLAFTLTHEFLATASRGKLSLWNCASGMLLWSKSLKFQVMALEFDENGAILMAATKSNTAVFWEVADGRELSLYHFSDIDETSQTEYQFRRPPIHVALSAGLNLLAVAYRQRPIIIWDLENFSYIGQLNKSTTTFPGPLVFAVVLNSKAEIPLAAATYDDGDLVVFDPWTQHEHATTSAQADILAVSADGTVLAAGNAEGVISLYDFETLHLFYRVETYEQGIRAVTFSGDNLRFLSINADHCNIWEPSTLLRRTESEDDCNADLSDEVLSEPHLVGIRLYDEDRAITALCPSETIDIVICGREDGSVAAYSTGTGCLVQELYSHTKNVALLLIDWNGHSSVIASVDRSGRLIARKIGHDDDGSILVHPPLINRKCSDVVKQVLVSYDGRRVLVSMAMSDELWDTEAGLLISSSEVDTPRTYWTWATHTSHPEKAVLFVDDRIHIYHWEALQEQRGRAVISLGFDPSNHARFFGAFISVHSSNVCLGFSGSRAKELPPLLRVLSLKDIHSDLANSICIASYDNLAKNVKQIFGVSRSSLIFLTHDGWICSLDITGDGEKSYFTKHFFIPFQYHSASTSLVARVTTKGSLILAYMDEVAVFHNGLEFQEKVGLKSAMMTLKPSMRLTMKKGISNPL